MPIKWVWHIMDAEKGMVRAGLKIASAGLKTFLVLELGRKCV